MDSNPYQAPQARPEPVASIAASRAGGPRPRGLGGWLILVALGLIATPIRLAVNVTGNLFPILTSGQWEELTTPGSVAYHALWAPLIIFEVFANLFFMILALILIFLFFTKSERFPRVYIAFLMLNLVFVVGDSLLAGLIPAIAADNSPESNQEVVRSLIGTAIWVPYMLVSKRVKNTFVGTKNAMSETTSANPRAEDA